MQELADSTVTGRRIRAADSNGTGSLTCVDQRILSRLMPVTDKLVLEKNSPVEISVTHIICDQAAGEITLSIAGTDNTNTLKDNGIDFDHTADDGIYSARFTLSTLGLDHATISIIDPLSPNETIDTFEVTTVSAYQKAENTMYSWRTLTDNKNLMDINPDLVNFFESPFPIHFADSGQGFTSVGVSPSGYLALTRLHNENSQIVSVGNGLLPFTLYSQFFELENIIAPFWENTYLAQGEIYWDVIGVEPKRELVIEWRDVTHFEVGGNVSFQVVFNEINSDIIFNYKDVEFGNERHDFGGYATVGVQSSPDFAQVHSVDSPKMQNATALLWRTSNNSLNNSSRNSSDGGGGVSTQSLLLLLLALIFINNMPRRYISK